VKGLKVSTSLAVVRSIAEEFSRFVLNNHIQLIVN